MRYIKETTKPYEPVPLESMRCGVCKGKALWYEEEDRVVFDSASPSFERS